MFSLFDQEKISEINAYNISKDAYVEGYAKSYAEACAKACAKGNEEVYAKIYEEAYAKGREEACAKADTKEFKESCIKQCARTDTRIEIARNLISLQVPFEKIAAATGWSLAEVEFLAGRRKSLESSDRIRD